LPQNELAELLSSAGALVFIPWFEGFGIPMVEAFASGTPVIRGNRTSLPEVAGGAGLEVDPADAAGVAAAMQKVECEPALRKALVARGRDRAEHFSWTKTAESLWACIAAAGRAAGVDMGGVADENAA
jgi:glycosyltransferase involved in cell wall biosynthesis